MLRSAQLPQGSSANHILGINLDGEKLLVVYGSPNGMVYERLAVPTPENASFAAVVELIMLQADKLLTLTQAQRLPLPDCVSVAISGNLDFESGVVFSAEDFPQWKQEPVRSQLSVRFNLPVAVEQKANAGALAEYYFGAGQKAHDFVFISLDPVVRVGILTTGQLYRNSSGTAGQLGKLPLSEEGPAGFGRPGSLTGFASARGMRELAQMRFPDHWNSDIDLFQMITDANAGDPYAQEVFAEAGAQLGNGLVVLTYLLQPEMIIVGFPGCLLGDVLIKPAQDALSQAARLDEAQLPKLIPSPLCTRLQALEALAPAVHQFHQLQP
jgi:glucokinase